MSQLLFYGLFLSAIFLSQIVQTEKIFINPKNNGFINKENQEIFMHGINIMKKYYPYIPDISESDVMKYHSRGVNLVRLGFIWRGVMPHFGMINRTYVQRLVKLVKLFGKYDIQVMLDNHQDLWSEQFCGDGAPFDESTIVDFPMPVTKVPYNIDPKYHIPASSDCLNIDWGIYYLAKDVHKNFEKLFTDEPPYNYQSNLIAVWENIAQAFKGIDNVLGFELINEPLPGNILKNISLFIPKNANKRLLELYTNITKAIKKIDSEQTIFFEPVIWSEGKHQIFENVPDADLNATFNQYSALSMHFYIPFNTNPVRKIETLQTNAILLKSGKILSEYYFDISSSDTLAELMDQYMISWMGWTDSMEFNDYNTALQLNRIYPLRISGDTIIYKFDIATQSFYAKYQINTECTQLVSEFFIPQILKVESISVTSSCSVKYKILKDYNRPFLQVTHQSDCPVGEVIEVRIN